MITELNSQGDLLVSYQDWYDCKSIANRFKKIAKVYFEKNGVPINLADITKSTNMEEIVLIIEPYSKTTNYTLYKVSLRVRSVLEYIAERKKQVARLVLWL